MHRIRSAVLMPAILAVSVLPVFNSVADNGQPPSEGVKAEIDTLPPVGKGHDMVRPYQKKTVEPVKVLPDRQRTPSRHRPPAPLSREIVPPSYRYGSPGYELDGRGGRGYDIGYPGYRDGGGGGYPHRRYFGTGRDNR